MCYSAQASFIAAVYLATIGLLCIKKNKVKKAALFASIPLIFAIQQATEGLLWLSFNDNWSFIHYSMPYIFMFFAFAVWPICIPASLTLLEQSYARKKHLILLCMLGIIVAVYLYSYIFLYGVSGQVLDCHIYYDVTIPASDTQIGTILYLLTTILPFFISSIRYMNLFGCVLFASYLISYQFYFVHLVSIWCFFAAILSSLAFVIITLLNKQKNKGSR